MKRVLIISYYWPPSGGSGVQRWLYFAKHLRSYGWEPIIYTVSNGEYPYLDEGLSQHIPPGIEVLKKSVWEPYAMYRKISGIDTKVDPTIMAELEKGSFFKKCLLWIRGNFFIPDARMFWIRPSVNYLNSYLERNKVDVIVSTGPPHSTHLIARNLKRKHKIPWLADFRDPWTQIYFFSQLNLSKLAQNIHLRLEYSVLKEANCVVTVSNDCKVGLQKRVNRKIEVITNGYEEFERKSFLKSDGKITMIYTGVLSSDRNPKIFWEQLTEFLRSKPEISHNFQLLLIGNIDKTIIEDLRKSKLAKHLVVHSSMPHLELQNFLNKADILLMIGVPNHKGVITGKFFEYLFLRKPIFSISPAESDVVTILNETKAGLNANFEDADLLMNNLNATFKLIIENSFDPDEIQILKYSRTKLTESLSALLEEINTEII
ncbi:MAG: glycosyltransferase [Saprospiraceae bacterium]|nr:glycosyltransferase [Saprospiraceae bacterium]